MFSIAAGGIWHCSNALSRSCSVCCTLGEAAKGGSCTSHLFHTWFVPPCIGILSYPINAPMNNCFDAESLAMEAPSKNPPGAAFHASKQAGNQAVAFDVQAHAEGLQRGLKQDKPNCS